jgi:type I restriction enzyme S subunit
MNKLTTYSQYKPSQIKEISKVPNHWNIKKLKYISNIIMGQSPEQKDVNQKNQGIPFLQGNAEFGQINPKEKNWCTNPKKITLKNDILYSVRAPIGAINISHKTFCIGRGLCALRNKEATDKKYLFYSATLFKKELDKYSTGSTFEAISIINIKNIKTAFPPKEEQTKIANYLDKKTEQINKAISQKKELIKLLKERQQILINDAVTKGIDKTVSMKKSNFKWLGEVPKHWEIKKGKYLFTEIDERSREGKEELLSVSHMTGVTPRSEKNVTMFMSENYTGSKTCQKDDLVINIMWAWMGALGISDREGIVSSSYGIYRQQKSNTFNSSYLEYLLRTNDFIAEYNRRSTGLHISRLRLYSDKFLDMKIAVPPIEEQNAIINFIKENNSKIDKAINLQEQQIERLVELKETLIDSCVTGKVKVP